MLDAEDANAELRTISETKAEGLEHHLQLYWQSDPESHFMMPTIHPLFIDKDPSLSDNRFYTDTLQNVLSRRSCLSTSTQ